jgi:hypothetical protein
MDRALALRLVAEKVFSELSDSDRESVLLDYATISEEDPGFETLPDDLNARIANGLEEFSSDDLMYEPLVQIGVRDSLIGVTKSILLNALDWVTKVEGDVEPLDECCCCGYKALSKRREYNVCPVCFWEDDGTESDEAYSSPNHLTLGEGKRNFQGRGVCSTRGPSMDTVDRLRKYVKGKRALMWKPQ